MIILLSLLILANAESYIEKESAGVYIINSLVALGLVAISGLMSGLTVGLMSIDEMDLELKLATGTSDEKMYARRILAIINRHHLVLVTLLVANSAAMEALPIILDEMFATVIAVMISVTFVMLFGEIIPQAVCTGPNQLKIAYKMVPFVKVVMFIFFPIAYPIAKLLDKVFGEKHGSKKFHSDELKTFIAMHESFAQESRERKNSGLAFKQIKIIHGAIDLKNEVVKNHMISAERIYSLSNETVLDKQNLKSILKQGFSRIPIYNGQHKNDVVGILLIKSLLCFEEGQSIKESNLQLKKPFVVRPNMTMLELFGKFKTEKTQLAFVKDDDILEGIITLGDLVQEILRTDILDEDDYDKMTGYVTNNYMKANNQGKRTIRPKPKRF